MVARPSYRLIRPRNVFRLNANENTAAAILDGYCLFAGVIENSPIFARFPIYLPQFLQIVAIQM